MTKMHVSTILRSGNEPNHKKKQEGERPPF